MTGSSKNDLHSVVAKLTAAVPNMSSGLEVQRVTSILGGSIHNSYAQCVNRTGSSKSDLNSGVIHLTTSVPNDLQFGVTELSSCA